MLPKIPCVFIVTSLLLPLVSKAQSVDSTTGNVRSSVDFRIVPVDLDSVDVYRQQLHDLTDTNRDDAIITQLIADIESSIIDTNNPHFEYYMSMYTVSTARYTKCVNNGFAFHEDMSAREIIESERGFQINALNNAKELLNESSDEEKLKWERAYVSELLGKQKTSAHINPMWFFIFPIDPSQIAFDIIDESLNEEDWETRFEHPQNPYRIAWEVLGTSQEFYLYDIIDSAAAVKIKTKMNRCYQQPQSGAGGEVNESCLDGRLNDCAVELLMKELAYMNELLDEVIYGNGIILVEAPD